MADLLAVVEVGAEDSAGSGAEEADLVGDLRTFELAAADLMPTALVYRTDIGSNVELLQLALYAVQTLAVLALLQLHFLTDLAGNADGLFVDEDALGLVLLDEVRVVFLEVVESEDGSLSLLAGHVRCSP